jgi:hypothetical protein
MQSLNKKECFPVKLFDACYLVFNWLMINLATLNRKAAKIVN